VRFIVSTGCHMEQGVSFSHQRMAHCTMEGTGMGRDHLEGLDVDRVIILKWTSEVHGAKL
jgi:hypothetical protein